MLSDSRLCSPVGALYRDQDSLSVSGTSPITLRALVLRACLPAVLPPLLPGPAPSHLVLGSHRQCQPVSALLINYRAAPLQIWNLSSCSLMTIQSNPSIFLHNGTTSWVCISRNPLCSLLSADTVSSTQLLLQHPVFLMMLQRISDIFRSALEMV